MNLELNQHIWSQFETFPTNDRVIFLGASNLSRSFPTAVSIARATLRAPLSIHVAMGPGRSYGNESGFLRKKFPKIFSCGVWQSLRQENVDRTVAFVTDVGNDLGYEVPVETILDWVTTCVDQLQIYHAKVVITALPIAVLERLSQVKFRVLRGLLFPTCRLTQTDLLDRAHQLNSGLEELTKSKNTSIFTVPIAWYGFDPIHPHMRHMTQFWRELFTLVGCSGIVSIRSRNSLILNSYLRCLTPPNSRCASSNEEHPIKRIQLFDGTRISLY
ncbi:hypothetical protein Pr1d_43750 [Bythopirellula goksoeyrii]|uniref:SGNH hydrolase-type esterase domain-containing protein n=1 Tax=Bythopirellula goksoeyrii TaxID=1400387 RepID=A0A5B9QH93_9BACT|nr:hypothetical protein Pr1d_43750 [Bythopirellula goksoeyrii]